MSSKTTFRAWQLAGEAAVAARRLAELVDAAQRDLLAPFRQEGSAGDLVASQLAVARMIEESAEKLMVLEDRYAHIGLEDRVRRAEAREEAVRLQRELAAARTLLLQHFGSNNGLALLDVGLKLRATRPQALARIGRQLVEILRAPDFTLPERPQAVLRLTFADPAALAAAVEEALLPVEALLSQSMTCASRSKSAKARATSNAICSRIASAAASASSRASTASPASTTTPTASAPSRVDAGRERKARHRRSKAGTGRRRVCVSGGAPGSAMRGSKGWREDRRSQPPQPARTVLIPENESFSHLRIPAAKEGARGRFCVASARP